MTNAATLASVGGDADDYALPGRGVHPEGLAYDARRGLIYTTSMLTGAVFRTTLDRRTFDVVSPAGANGCRSSTGLAVDVERRRLVVCGGVSGRVHLFDADSAAPMGYATNGLVDDLPAAMAPSATAPSFVNDIAFVGGDAYITDSYHPALFRLGRDVIRDGCGAGTVRLERWLDLAGTPDPLPVRRHRTRAFQPQRHCGDARRALPPRRPDQHEAAVPHRGGDPRDRRGRGPRQSRRRRADAAWRRRPAGG